LDLSRRETDVRGLTDNYISFQLEIGLPLPMHLRLQLGIGAAKSKNVPQGHKLL
jgi:hypothetical protein